MDTLVADSSPLIGLARIGELHLLPALAREVLVSETVWKEITQARPTAPGATLLSQQPWIQVRKWDHLPIPQVLAGLGRGDTEAIVLTQAVSGELLIDDLVARRAARLLRIPYLGTLAFLGRAKRAGIIKEVRPLSEKLKANGIYIADAVLRAVLNELGENL